MLSLPGCLSEGDTKEEALKNVREAIALYLEPVENDMDLSPRIAINVPIGKVALDLGTIVTLVRSFTRLISAIP